MSKADLRALRLLQRFESECSPQLEGNPWHHDPLIIARWLGAHESTVSPNTFRCHRRWLAAYVEKAGFPDIAGRIREVGAGRKPKTKNCPAKREGRGYQKKSDTAKFVDQVTPLTINRLADELLATQKSGGTSKYQFGTAALLWLQAASMTGVRPVEWRTAMLLDSVYCPVEDRQRHAVLQVTTAKGRSESELAYRDRLRYLILESSDDNELAIIESLLAAVPGDGKQFRGFYDGCRKAFERAVSNISLALGGPLTMYSARHIFCSELRASRSYNRQQVAALMGHTDTANQVYYGGRPLQERKFSFSLPAPWPEAVEAVYRVDKSRNSVLYQEQSTPVMDFQ